MDIVKFWLVKNKISLNEKIQNSEITDNCIVFIEDTREVWTHGQFYGTDFENFKALEDKITSIQNVIKNEIGPSEDSLKSHVFISSQEEYEARIKEGTIYDGVYYYIGEND